MKFSIITHRLSIAFMFRCEKRENNKQTVKFVISSIFFCCCLWRKENKLENISAISEFVMLLFRYEEMYMYQNSKLRLFVG